MKKTLTYILALAATLTAGGCIEEDSFDNSYTGNFDALWNTIDQRYCFFDYSSEAFGLDWEAVYHKYRPKAEHITTGSALFDLMGEMLSELRDGHVNLTSEYGTTYYWDWKLHHPLNFSDSIQRNYLGDKFRLNNGIIYTTLPDTIGYAYVGSFSSMFGDSNLTAMMMSLAHCKGLIIDIRNNGGGLLTASEQLATHFTDKKTHCGYIRHKTGTGHSDLSSPRALYLERGNGAIWLRPTVVLTNRGVFSAANHFVMLMRELPHVLILGDKTGGGSGMPLNSTLPNGWGVRFSACPILDKEGRITEFGIEPDTLVHITDNDWQRGRDTMIEAACKHILDCNKKNNDENTEK